MSNIFEKSLQDTNYFSYLDIQPSFDIDLGELENKYLAIQQQVHPDLFASKPEEEKTLALKHSVFLNEAFETLAFPMPRAEHLLALQGIIVNQETHTVEPDQEVLAEVMEHRETLHSIYTLDVLNEFKDNVAATKDECIKEISRAFVAENYPHAAQLTIRLRYLEKTLEEIQVKSFDLRTS